VKTLADLKAVEKKVSKVPHGFAEMKEEGVKISGEGTLGEKLATAKQLYGSEKHQVRMVGVFVLGFAPYSREAVSFLREEVSRDPSCQVQEILAQSFNEYCKAMGYERSLPVIRDWLGDRNPNVRRSAAEGPRIWNQRDYFREHPEVAVKLLAALKNDDSEYVRKSVGNSIRDISRKEKDLVRKELKTWDLSNPRTKFTYGLASKFL